MLSCIPLYGYTTSCLSIWHQMGISIISNLGQLRPILLWASVYRVLQTLMIISLVLCESCSVLSNSLRPHRLYIPENSPDQNTGVGSLSPLQGIFPTQGSNPGLPHCGLILYQLSHKGSPRILEWVAYPFSSISSRPRNQTEPESSALQVDSELSGKPFDTLVLFNTNNSKLLPFFQL